MQQDPKRSHEPPVWLMFGAGTTISAIVFPVLILLIGFLIPLELINPKGLENLISFASSFLGKLIILAILVFPIWGALHRTYHGLHDLKIHFPFGGVIFYGLAGLLSILAIFIVF